jgi:fucose 4-O-acetylase-like acetyltransferase
MKTRDSKIDCLRVLGILLIILAHCDAPKFINDL